jgi:fructokinase
VVGTGFIALDAVVSAEKSVPVRHWAGGTCGNVLIALRYLGWAAKPIARLGTSKVNQLLVKDLRRWRVSQAFVRTDPEGSTPVIVERITKDASGNPKHSFHWRCDGCGSRYPGYKPELLGVAEKIAPKIAKAKVFFFDRVSAGALHLARAAKDAGALVFFEPCSIGNPLLFRQAWEVSHVVKYSHERLSDFPELAVEPSPRLVVETLGDAGLRYLRRSAANRAGTWTNLNALPVNDLKDAAGAGDWCTAGIISKLGANGFAGFSKTADRHLTEAMQFGQALASWNCRFEGARGGMYAVSKAQFRTQIEDILCGTADFLSIDRNMPSHETVSNALCSICELASGTKVQVKKRKAR